MAYAFARQYIYTDLVVDPRDVMVNVNEVAKEMGGFIDRDNVDESVVTAAKVASGSLNTIGDVGLNGSFASPVFTLGGRQTGAWTDITGLVATVTTDDGAIFVDAWVAFAWQWFASQQRGDRCEWRVLIDGVAVSSSGWFHFDRTATTCILYGYLPVDAGTHIVSMQVRALSAPWIELTANFTGSNPDASAEDNVAWTSSDIYVTKGYILWRHEKR